MNKIKTILMSVLTLTILFLFTQETKAQRFSHMTTPSVSTDWIEFNPNVEYGKDYTEWANQQNQYVINDMMTDLTNAYNESKSKGQNFFNSSLSSSNAFNNFSIDIPSSSNTTIINNYYNSPSCTNGKPKYDFKNMDLETFIELPESEKFEFLHSF